MQSFDDHIDKQRKVVDELLDARLPKNTERPYILHEAIRYAVFSGGKRLRPLLCCLAAEVMGMSFRDVLLPAISIEALHTYTLVHDDLPAMDDDDFRRGKPTVHKQYNEAVAILVGDALLTLSFEWLSESVPKTPYVTADLIRELAAASGSKGVVGGQVEDLTIESTEISVDDLTYIHFRKTALLMRSPLRLGAMMAGASKDDLRIISSFGEHIGLAYQLADDLMDNGPTVQVMKKERIETSIKNHLEEAKIELDKLTGNTEHLKNLAELICRY